jgi:hypothetical protein
VTNFSWKEYFPFAIDRLFDYKIQQKRKQGSLSATPVLW